MSDEKSSIAGPRIAVAGATGRVGGALLDALRNDAADVVALSRTEASNRLPSGMQIAKIDFDERATLVGALQGADRLFLAHGTSDRQVENEIAMIDAAVAAGVSHIVKLSAMGPPTQRHPFDWHMKIEAHLANCSIGYTVLRPSCFVDTLARAKAPVASGTWGGTAGEGRVNLIDTRDVASVARVVLLADNLPSSQRAFHLTGPGTMSMPEIANELSRLLGRTVSYTHRSHAEQREILVASGTGEMAADLLLGLDRIFRESALAETTTTVTDLTGEKPRSVMDWLADNLDDFGPGTRLSSRNSVERTK